MTTTNIVTAKKAMLSIEPDYLMQVYIRKKIKRQGLQVNLAVNFTEALDLLNTNIPVDQVLMDAPAVTRELVLFLRQLKLNKNFSEIKIYVSGNTDNAKFQAQLKKEKIDPAMITGYLEDLMDIDTILDPLSAKKKA